MDLGLDRSVYDFEKSWEAKGLGETLLQRRILHLRGPFTKVLQRLANNG